MPGPAERDNAEHPPSPASKEQGRRGRRWATLTDTPARVPLSPLDPAWRTQLPHIETATPLQSLLDPGLGMATRPARALESSGTPAGLTDMTRLEVWQLLETPEIPVHRAPRSGEHLPPEQDWRLRPPSERGRHDAPLTLPHEEEEDLLPPAEPRAYVMGQVYEETVDASLEALAARQLALPDIGKSGHVRLQVDLGRGEGVFLNARSALWSWRPHRQAGLQVHTHGPPLVGRDLLLEQRVGLVTVLQGCRVMTLNEEERLWGLTVGSLEGQVYRLWERLLVEWHADDRVTLAISSHHEVSLRGFGLVGPLLSSARRSTVQGYARNMADLARL